ncbi:hypothetical protein N1851_005233 [Merluccius polli]|uniref:BED-type domain-containing protein n=1 Tax=Merluccius polli TaxID=89951 RepID=A0AA47N7G4_MERPO|nr:hypothetical protein N1851_005233 [Merluccius polli]
MGIGTISTISSSVSAGPGSGLDVGRVRRSQTAARVLLLGADLVLGEMTAADLCMRSNGKPGSADLVKPLCTVAMKQEENRKLFCRQPGKTEVCHASCAQSLLTNSIGIVRLQRYRFFLTIPHFPARRFPVFPKFCVAVHCVTVDATAQTFQQQGSSSIMERRRRSKVWLHFTKRDECTAVCNQCNAAISCKGANTSNMLKHLSTKHGIKYQDCHVFKSLRTSETSSTVSSVDDDSSQAAGPSTTSAQVSPFMLAAQGATWNEEKMNECHRAVTKFVVKGLHPFSTVEQPYFR